MRIKRSDNERLVVVHFPLFLAVIAMLPAMMTVFVAYGTVTGLFNPPPKGQSAWLGVLFFLLFSVGWAAIFALFVKRVTYDFDLLNRRLAWSRRGLYGKKEGIMSLDDIRGVTVDTRWSSDSGRTYCPVLSTSNGMFPLLNYTTPTNRTTSELRPPSTRHSRRTRQRPWTTRSSNFYRRATRNGFRPFRWCKSDYGYALPQARQFVDALKGRLSREPKQADGGEL